MKKEEKKFLLSLGFKAEFPDEMDTDYCQYVKHFKHSFIKGLHIIISDNIIDMWGVEEKGGINGGDYLITKKKFSQKNLLKMLAQII